MCLVHWFYLAGCDPGKPGTGNCCKPDNTCGEGEGDCDENNDCTGDLICGNNNCRQWNPSAPESHDCCEKGTSYDTLQIK